MAASSSSLAGKGMSLPHGALTPIGNAGGNLLSDSGSSRESVDRLGVAGEDTSSPSNGTANGWDSWSGNVKRNEDKLGANDEE